MGSRNDRSTRELRALLLGACGLGPVACGGIAVFDDGQGGGSTSSGTSAASTTRATSATASGSTRASTAAGPCTTPADAIPVCLPAAKVCPEPSAALYGELEKVLETTPCEEPEFCSCDWTVNTIYCATPGAGCCYAVSASLDRICEGLPFVVEGASRVATLVTGSDWTASGGALLAALPRDAADRAFVAARYREDALAEHASVASFARLVLSLLAFGAPADVVARAQRAAGEEIRHAELCFAIARAFDGDDAAPGALDVRGALDGRLDVEGFVTAVVREGCIEETISALSAARARDAAAEPALVAALDEIARDEAEHAALAYRVVAFMIGRHGEPARAAAQRAFDTGIAARESALTRGVACETGDVRAGFEAYGRLDATSQRDAARDAIRDAIRPAAAALLTTRLTAPSEARGDARTSDLGA